MLQRKIQSISRVDWRRQGLSLLVITARHSLAATRCLFSDGHSLFTSLLLSSPLLSALRTKSLLFLTSSANISFVQTDPILVLRTEFHQPFSIRLHSPQCRCVSIAYRRRGISFPNALSLQSLILTQKAMAA